VSGAERYEDACNIYAYGGAETIRHKPFDLSQDGMPAEQVVEMLREMAGAGTKHLIFNMP